MPRRSSASASAAVSRAAERPTERERRGGVAGLRPGRRAQAVELRLLRAGRPLPRERDASAENHAQKRVREAESDSAGVALAVA